MNIAAALVALILAVVVFRIFDAAVRKRGASYSRLCLAGLALAASLIFYVPSSLSEEAPNTLFIGLLSLIVGMVAATCSIALAAQRSEGRLARWCRRALEWQGYQGV